MKPIHHRTWLKLWTACAAGAWALALGGVSSAPAITITRTSGAILYTDIPKGLSCAYASYAVSNDTAGTTYSNIWVKIDTFTGTIVKLGGGDPGIYSLDDLAPGQVKMVFVYLQATNTTSSPQSHTVRVYDGYPGAGGTALANTTFSVTVSSTLANQSSKVNSVSYNPNPPILGGYVMVNVAGDCGTVKSSDLVDFTPAAFTNWNAAAFELVGVSLTLTNKTGAVTNLANYLELPSALAVWANGGITYAAQYRFHAIAVTATNTPVSPMTYASQGQSSSHAPADNYGSFAPILTPTNATLLSKLASVAQLYTNTALTYTVRITNSSAVSVTLDRIADTLPAGFTYVAGSSRFAGTVILDPNVSGSVLTWSESYSNPPTASRDLTFQAVPAIGGYATNAAVAYSGNTLIDTTYPTTDDAPATAGVRVLLAPTAVNDTGATLEDAALSVPVPGVLVNDLEPNGFAITVASYTQPAHGSVIVATNGAYTYTPVTNYNGVDSFTYTLTNGNGRASTATVNLSITEVNDPPGFTKGADQTVLMNAGAQTVAGWATGISAGPTNESGQILVFHVSSDNPSLFSVQPALSTNGTLTYTPAANVAGIATVTVTLQDDGGTTNGGNDCSATQTFTIQLTAYSLGNRVFADLNNNGSRDFGEDGISGVRLLLFTNSAGLPAGSALMATNTDAHGDYRFDGMPTGTYVVVVDVVGSSNLTGWLSSYGYATNLDLGSDMQDHGKDTSVTVGDVTNGIASVPVTVGPGLQPTNEIVANQPGAGQHGSCGDLYDNLVLDFGFTPAYSLGNRVFYDDDHDGLQDAGEGGAPSVPMYAFAVDSGGRLTGDALASATTDSNGWYRLDGLRAGTYMVVVDKVVATNLDGYESTIGTSTNMTIAGDLWDHGWYPPVTAGPVTNGRASSPVTLGVGLQPTNEVTNSVSGPGAHGPTGDQNDNLVLDFAYTRVFTVGNRVFADDGSGGGTANDGIQNGSEPGISNVVLRAFAADTNGNATGDALVIGTSNLNLVVTDTNGCYQFSRLSAGSYVIAVDVELSRSLHGYACISGATWQVEGAASTSLVGYASSAGYSSDLTLAGDLRDHGHDLPVSLGIVTNGIWGMVVTVGQGALPTNEWTNGVSGAGAHGIGGDIYDTLVMDFGFTPGYSIGNRVFLDNGAGGGVTNNGIQDGSEPGIADVCVQLKTNGTIVATATTDTNGYYRFDDLRSGAYTAFLPVSNFSVAGALAGLLSSSNTVAGDRGDKGVDDAAPASNGIATAAITLGYNLQTNETDIGTGAGANGLNGDAYDDLTIDFGLVEPNSDSCGLGSLVWHDANNNGSYDAGESGIANVILEAWNSDVAGNLIGGSPVATSTTAVDGTYFIGALTAGTYRVRIPTNMFNADQPLYSIRASSTLRYDEDGHVDGNNNGLQAAAGQAVLSPVIELGRGGEPVDGAGYPNEFGPGAALDNARDANGDMTVDFGFFSPADDQANLCSLGSLVWVDRNNNGVREAAETNGVTGVQLDLYRVEGGTNRTFWHSTTSGADGTYFFADLPSGTNWQVHIPVSNFTNSGVLSIYPLSGGTATNADNRTDDDNNAVQAGGLFAEAWSPVIALDIGAEPTNTPSGPTGEFGPGYGQDNTGVYVEANGDMTVDFGFTPTYSIGNQVFGDTDNDGVMDGGETGAVGVAVLLFAADGSGNPSGAALAATNTDDNGYYRFDNLALGVYVVVVDVSNSPSLVGTVSSTGVNTNTGIAGDLRDHGKDAPVTVGAVTNGIASASVAAGWALQPAGEATGPGAGTNGPNGDGSDNLVVDFGFTPTYSIGNKAYRDPDNDGQPDLDNLDEGGISNAILKVYFADGSGNPTGAPLATATTDADGFYRFDGLVAGTYVIVVDKTNTPSLDLYSSVDGVSSDTSVSGELYDHGKDTPLGPGSVLPGGIPSTPVTVGPGLQPVGEGTAPGQGGNGPNGDESDNLVMDLGFRPDYSLGNRVFLDNGSGAGGVTNDGIQNGSEPGLSSVALKLFAADGEGNPAGGVLCATNTDANGYFRFDGLTAGTYVVVVDLAASAGLTGRVSSVGASADTAITGDLQDHGLDTPVSAGAVTNGIASTPVTIGKNGLVAPLGETTGTGAGAHGPNTDDSDNLVVDFGFIPAASLAGCVRVDMNGNGAVDANDSNGIAGVTVMLQTTNGAAVATTLTVAGGAYAFTMLPPGDYVVVETDLPGWLSTGDTQGANDNRIAVTLASGQDSAGNDFLDTQAGSIAGAVQEDRNGDGALDAGDSVGIAGVTVTLQTTNGAPVATNVTDAGGAYQFAAVPPGDYVVVETDLPDWLSTGDTQGANDNRIAVTLASGQDSAGNYFFDVTYATIAGRVLFDVNGNGAADLEDTNVIAGVTVTLLDAGSNTVATFLTAVDGAYSFTNLLPGGYTVLETDPAGYLSTGDTGGANDNRIAISVTSRQSSTGNNFLDTQPVDIGIFKTVDNGAPVAATSIIYTLVATNQGPDNATGVVIADTVPEGLTFVSASSADYSGGLWTIGSLAAGAGTSLTLNVTVNFGVGGCALTNTARVSAVTQLETNFANNTSSVSISVSSAPIWTSTPVTNATEGVLYVYLPVAIDPAYLPVTLGGVVLPAWLTLTNTAGSGAAFDISTAAGTGAWGSSGDNGPATAALLAGPAGVAVDASSNWYFSDCGSNRVRKVRADGVVEAFAGTGTPGYSGDGEMAISARLSAPIGLALDAAGNLYVVDAGNKRVRRVGTDGGITTVAGTGAAGFNGDSIAATNADLDPTGVALDSVGALYVADYGNHRIRRVGADGIIRTVAGTGAAGFNGDGIAATSAQLDRPFHVAVDAEGVVYIADYGNNRVRSIGVDGIIRTVAGTGVAGFNGDGIAATSAQLDHPTSVALDGAGAFFVADNGNLRIRRVGTNGVIETVAGTGATGSAGDGGPATDATFQDLYDVQAAGDEVYIADYAGCKVRKLALTASGWRLSGTPLPAHLGTNPVTLTADNGITNALQSFDIVVAGLARPLVCNASGAVVSNGMAPSAGLGTDFGTVASNQTQVLALSLTNFGTAALTISGVITSGAAAAFFSVSNFPGTVDPGTVSNFFIAYRPMAYGAHVASFSIANNGTNTPYVIRVAGAGVQAGEIGVNRGAFDFEVTYGAGDPPAQTYVITNQGGLGFAYSNVSGAAWFSVSAATGWLDAGAVQIHTGVVSVAGLDAGVYVTTNTVASGSASNSAAILVTLTIAQATQAIAFAAISDQCVTNVFSLAATASSGQGVTFTVAGGPGAINGGTNLSFTADGTVFVVASQTGNVNYLAAPSVTQRVNVLKSDAGVSLSGLNHVYDGAIKTATITTVPAGLSVQVTYDFGPAPSNAGMYTVRATIEDSVYQGQAIDSFVIAKADQVVTFPSIADQCVTSVVGLSASAGCGAPVTFAVASGPAVLGGGTNLAFTNVGPVRVTAAHAGNENYNAAPTRTNAFRVYDTGLAVLGTNGAVIASDEPASAEKGAEFEPVAAGAEQSHRFAITNGGHVRLEITGVTTAGAQNAEFQVEGLPEAVAAGSASNFTVVFAPPAPGIYTAAVVIANNFGSTAYVVQVRGTAIATGGCGCVAIEVTPPEGSWALAAPAGYTGPTSGTGSLAPQCGPTGAYAVSYGALAGYASPLSATQFVVSGATSLFAGVYLPVSAALRRPSAVAATDGEFTGLIRVSWHAVAGALSYDLWRSRIHRIESAELIASVAADGALLKSESALDRSLKLDNILLCDDRDVLPIESYYYWVQARSASLASPFSYPDPGYAALDANAVEGLADLRVYDHVFLPVNATNDSTAGTVSFWLKNQGPQDLVGADVQFDFYMVTSNGLPAFIGADRGTFALAAGQERLVILSPQARRGLTVRGDLSGVQTIRLTVRHLGALSDPNSADNATEAVGRLRIKPSGENSPGRSMNDYDGDGKSDVAVCRSDKGVWAVLLSGTRGLDVTGIEAATAGGQFWTAAGDYDGDGLADYGLYEEFSGAWWIRQSSDGRVLSGVFGGPECRPVPADYDGDRKADPAIYVPRYGYWLILRSGSDYATVEKWAGGLDCEPVMADYDGDSLADIMAYHEKDGHWTGLLSGQNYAPVDGVFGGPGFRGGASDFDGDGVADPALYRDDDGLWVVLLSGAGYQGTFFVLGGPGYSPALGDYDGDGLADPGVYALEGLWYVWLSGQNYAWSFARFGGPSYYPVSEVVNE